MTLKIDGNAGSGKPKINGNGTSSSQIFRGGVDVARFPGVEDTRWPYFLYTNQTIKDNTSRLSANDTLCSHLFFENDVSVSGLSNWADLTAWMAANWPAIQYGVGSTGSEALLIGDYNTLAANADANVNWQPGYPGGGAFVPVANGITSDDILGPLTINDGPNGYNNKLQLLNTYRNAPRKLLIERAVSTVCYNNTPHLFIDDFPYGLLDGDLQDFGSAARAELPTLLAMFRDALHAVGKRMIPNCFRWSYESVALSRATGAATDAIMFEFTLDNGGTSTADVVTKLSFGTDLATHFKHVNALAAGGALVMYLPSAGTGQSYTDMTNFFTALSIMVGRALCLRSISAAIPASASWASDLGARISPVSVNSDIATCEFQHGTLRIDATNFTATKT